MATGRIRRTARRGIAVAVLGWLGIAAASVLLAPSASAAPSVTVEIRNVTPPAASVDAGGTVTFVNKIPPQNKGGISIPLVGSFSATVHTDVAVSFFGQQRTLAYDGSAQWKFTAAATPGTITYTYRIVPQSGLAANVANQVVSTVAAQLPPLPAPIPYVVQTIAPAVPNLPGVNVPQLPQVTVPNPLPGGTPTPPDGPLPPGGPDVAPQPNGQPGPVVQGTDGAQYEYGAGGVSGLAPVSREAAAAFDPARFGGTGDGRGLAGGAGASGGSGGLTGRYDGASVPVFGELAGLDGSNLDEESAERAAVPEGPASTLPVAALAAVVALAAVTAALVRVQQAQRDR
jgi:hypothetical protein